jgi:hypothetical protein
VKRQPGPTSPGLPVATIAELIHREGWLAQCEASAQNARGEAPHLTVDAAMLLLDRALRAVGSTQACTRADVEAAFAHLADPLVGLATWLAPSRDALVLLSPPAA